MKCELFETKETIFGGAESQQKRHLHKIYVSRFQKDHQCTLESFDRVKICTDIVRKSVASWTKEVRGTCLQSSLWS
ncbi:hypothetical protein TNCT_434951 [Trichonephila clavata]|uniref:Uncharacterized protein n=1 Tax=Trichonephila clavata TaxID=2740835 RepID=A0A8X6G1S0_TRICU|nr:hypothetical protein TNCT_434951 [Trichonephila clavata]